MKKRRCLKMVIKTGPLFGVDEEKAFDKKWQRPCPLQQWIELPSEQTPAISLYICYFHFVPFQLRGNGPKAIISIISTTNTNWYHSIKQGTKINWISDPIEWTNIIVSLQLSSSEITATNMFMELSPSRIFEDICTNNLSMSSNHEKKKKKKKITPPLDNTNPWCRSLTNLSRNSKSSLRHTFNQQLTCLVVLRDPHDAHGLCESLELVGVIDAVHKQLAVGHVEVLAPVFKQELLWLHKKKAQGKIVMSSA